MSYGCGSDTCQSCYPLIYRCECGEDYPEPVPNDGRELPECSNEECDNEYHDRETETAR